MNINNLFMPNRIREARIGLHWVRVSTVAILICSSCWHSQAEDAKAALAAPAAVATTPASVGKESSLTADQALQRLIEGNRRYVAGAATHPDQTTQRRAELAKGQFAFAIVLTCSDSRVVPELFLDQGLGDLFVVRNAGNILDDHVIGSMDYAVEHLHVPLVLVVGHEKCGAVSAAVAGGEAPCHIRSVVAALEFNATAHFRQREGGYADFSGMPREPILNRIAKTEVITYDVRIRQVFQNRHGGTLSVWDDSNVKPWATKASKWSAKSFLASLTSRVRRRASGAGSIHQPLPSCLTK